MKCWLREDIADQWRGQDPFRAVAAMTGPVYREVKGRRTFLTELDGRRYFIKHHHGVGWAEIFKNLCQLRRPVLGAQDEWAAVAALKAAGIPTLEPAAYGERGWNPARRESFLMTDALEPTVNLETFCERWAAHRPPPLLKWRLIRDVARMSRAMHAAGVCHRDYYLCHFLLRLDDKDHVPDHKAPQLHLIDLHRARRFRRLPRRWRLKDLAALLFSARDIGLTRGDQLRFLREYSRKPLRSVLREDAALWSAVREKAWRIQYREGRRLKRQLYRDGERIWRVQDRRQLLLCDRSHKKALQKFLAQPDQQMAAGEMLKDGDSTTVVRLRGGGREYVVKRYNLMGPWHAIRRAPRPSRAWHCWYVAHRLLELGLKTPRPVAMLECRVGILRRQAYYVSEYEAGPNVLESLDGEDLNGPRWQRAKAQFHALFSLMQREQLVHGDMKASNFISRDDGLWLLDLDATRQIASRRIFLRYFHKDLRRFLKNWQHDPAVLTSMRDMLKEFAPPEALEGGQK